MALFRPNMSQPSPNCYLCGRAGMLLHDNLHDRLCGSPGIWTLKQCPASDCGLVWLDPAPTPDELREAYQDYYTHTDEADSASLAQHLYRQILQLTPIGIARTRLALMLLDKEPPGRLLEVGCGNGKRLAAFRDRGWIVEGQEIDPKAAHFARENFQLTIHLDPIENLAGTYDAVIMNHVIEHIPDPILILKECRRLLHGGGVLVLTTPNVTSYGHRRFGAAWRGLEPPRHLHLFSPATIRQMAQQSGFLQFTVTTTSARAAGFALGSQLSVLRALWFQFIATARLPRHPDDGEECILRASK
jgi:2-polyprenyl-3-methyl-5-hydroxy-6-metoxy-1,4-benzoquinol methylase